LRCESNSDRNIHAEARHGVIYGVKRFRSRGSDSSRERIWIGAYVQKVFISYRRIEAEMVAGRLRESLAKRLRENAIFRDKNSIPGGVNWKEFIEARLTSEVVVLALVGPTWATACGDAGIRRLDDPNDWNRIELELALKHSARVIPLLIEETLMPAREFEADCQHQCLEAPRRRLGFRCPKTYGSYWCPSQSVWGSAHRSCCPGGCTDRRSRSGVLVAARFV
jgi:hypothetical protein